MAPQTFSVHISGDNNSILPGAWPKTLKTHFLTPHIQFVCKSSWMKKKKIQNPTISPHSHCFSGLDDWNSFPTALSASASALSLCS